MINVNIQKVRYFARFIFKALMYHKILTAMICMIIMLIFMVHYFILAQLNSLPAGFMILILIENFSDQILRILLLKIRNTALNYIRKDYLKTILSNRFLKKEDFEYGKDFIEIKRLSTIITRLEIDARNIIMGIISLLSKLLIIFFNFNLFYFIIILFNLLSTLIIIKYSKITRLYAFKKEEEFGKKIMELLHSHALSENISWGSVDEVLSQETQAYENFTISMRYYKIFAYCGNILIFMIFHLFQSIESQLFIAFIFSWIKFSEAISSINGFMSGINNFKAPMIKIDINQNKEINIINLIIDGIFHNVSVNIKYNEKIALIGDNGCGKTLLCNIIARHYSDFNGTIQTISSLTLKNINITSALDKKILYKHFPKYQNLFDEVNLSRGQQNFIATLFAAISNVDLLILDETLENLDKQYIDELIDILFELNKTIIVVSHRDYIIRKFAKILIVKDRNVVEFKD